MKFLALLVLVSCGVSVWAQFDDDIGPAPPRIQIPGAIPLPAGGRPPLRRQRIQAPPGNRPVAIPAVNVVRNRRPGPARALAPLPAEPSFSNNVIPASPSPPPPPPSPSPISFSQSFAPPLDSIGSTAASPSPPPVQESPEEDDYDEDDLVLPQGSPTASSPRTPIAPTRPLNLQPAVFRPTRPAFKPTSPPPPEINVAVRQQSRPPSRPAVSSTARPLPLEDELVSRNTPPRAAYRPSPAPPSQVPVRQQAAEPYVRPTGRTKKPVSQVIQRYREDNADGSITWGFENDDGTFKEETIGIDCTVRGKYGYIDPDGQRREYAYTSGIPCDKDKKNQEGGDGFVDYQDNKYILPNGETLDADAVVKNKARRPVQNFRP
ncbi:uncharacterized protein [Anabrus simplex]|uniref:uncharacterized protein n=1 Tax=Anabrus simplex TaxID=316456 RepID=UPI0035A32513